MEITAEKAASATQQDEKDVSNLRKLAALHFSFGRVERGISLLQLAIWISPRDLGNIRLLAVFCYCNGQIASSSKLIREFELSGALLPPELRTLKMRINSQNKSTTANEHTD